MLRMKVSRGTHICVSAIPALATAPVAWVLPKGANRYLVQLMAPSRDRLLARFTLTQPVDGLLGAWC